jgi:predicted dehydrogenase
MIKRLCLIMRVTPSFVAVFLTVTAINMLDTSVSAIAQRKKKPMHEVRLITLDPGHFHAALIQKEMYDGVSPRVSVYAPLGTDLLEHLGRITRFNSRRENPTRWELDVHTGDDFLARMLSERPGNVVVISGRNRGKIDRIKSSVSAGLNVLADKPWIISIDDFPKLEQALDDAYRKKLIAYDVMTERFEITTILQKAIAGDPRAFGTIVHGTPEAPALEMESAHHLMKMVAGAPNLRPAWFFDVSQQGEGLADVNTHLVDLALWMLFHEQPIDYRKDLEIVSARRWPTVISRAEFQRVTNEPDFTSYLTPNIKNRRLEYFCNGEVFFKVRGISVKLSVKWNYEAPPGTGDMHAAVLRGTKSRVEVRQGKPENHRPEVYVVPNQPGDKAEVAAALEKRIESLQDDYADVGIEDLGSELRLTIPDRYRVGHEAHFAEVTSRFLKYLGTPSLMPGWEKSNMLAKYWVTTNAVRLSHR